MDHTRNLHLSILECVRQWPAVEPKPDVAVMASADPVVRLRYASEDEYAARISRDVESLRGLSGFVCVESWADTAAPPSTFLRYVRAPIVAAPVPLAPRPPAPVPASPSRRR
jgi:hypothetical protein